MSTPPNRRGLLTRLLSAKTPEEIEVERLKLIARPDSADKNSLPDPTSGATQTSNSNPSPAQSFTSEDSVIDNNHSLDSDTTNNTYTQINQTLPPQNKESIGHLESLIDEPVIGSVKQALSKKAHDSTIADQLTFDRNKTPRPSNAALSKTEAPSESTVKLSIRPNANKIQNANSLSRKRGITPVDRSFDLSLHLRRAKELYRLNRTEIALYETFLKWTHAIGKAECSATNRKIGEDNGLSEKNIRRGLKTLSTRGLIIQLQPYNPYNHEPALFSVHLLSIPTQPI